MTEKKNSLDPALRCRILRYLYTGNEVPKYYPGCWEAHNYFKIDKLTALNEALTNDPNNTEVINLIVKVGSKNEKFDYLIRKNIRVLLDII